MSHLDVELLTDAGAYCVHFGRALGREGARAEAGAAAEVPLAQLPAAQFAWSPPETARPLRLDERAVVFCAAALIDLNYFSRGNSRLLQMRKLG